MIANQVVGLLAAAIPPAPVGDYESIQTITLTSNQATVTFDPIPSGYKHLQLRIMAKNTVGMEGQMRFNGDTSASYSKHTLSGNGSSASATGAASTTHIGIFNNPSAEGITGCVVDILDYLNTSKNKTVRSLSGQDNNGSGNLYLYSGAWYNTAAISSLSIAGGGNYMQYSSFALYGVK